MYNSNYFQQMPNYTNGMNWCQGEAGAKSYPVAPGSTTVIFDSEENTFYVKTVDVMGRPLPLKILNYTERTNEPKEEKPNPLDEAMTSLNEKLDEVLVLLAKPEKVEKKEEKKETKKDAK